MAHFFISFSALKHCSHHHNGFHNEAFQKLISKLIDFAYFFHLYLRRGIVSLAFWGAIEPELGREDIRILKLYI